MTALRRARLEEVAQVFGGGTPSRQEPSYFGGGIAWATPTDVTGLNDLYLRSTRESVTEAGLRNSSTKLLPAGAVLLTSRATIGFTAVADIPVCTNQGFVNFVCGPELVPEFLAFWLRTQKAKMLQHAGGTTFKEIARGVIRRFEIAYPSIQEQRRIVDLLTRAEGIVRLRREAAAKAAELIPALFIHHFGDPATNPMGWPVTTLGEVVVRGPSNGLYKHKSAYGKGVPILRIDAFYDGVVRDLSTLKRLQVDPDELQRFGLQENDIVINRVNSPEYLGKSALIPALPEPTVFESNMMRLAVDPARALPRYVIALLQTGAARAHFLSNAKHAINQSSINQQDVKSLPIALPPIDIQHSFLAHASAMESIQRQQIDALAKAQSTFDALLAQAFAPA